ncbi:endonuclease/exonuclease/phosphatase family protein [Flavobacterium sp.]|uniref:endonuclease/exonuclease/phosphatase family protein n=1 Tax=Flavobacterium sp. TaxID=239 RepID=UPI002B4AC8AA|nr:endonuclease/exonuclease/phosphatase family protein [Flavobacterium sp.]HLP65458.1 endonuclease/exonuclease/phosphatase family protein [Flavobacterium sp.]
MLQKKLLLLLILFFSGLQMNAQSLKLMSYNIRLDIESDGENDWTHRKDFFLSQIQFYNPDIFGVQEAKPNQVTDISNSLIAYNSVGIGREGVGKGEASTIYFKKEQFDVLQESTFWLSETPDTISMGWDAACHRVCTYALFKDKKSKKQFWVFNTHLDHMGEVARNKGIELILTKIKVLNTKNFPVVFMGDFNSEPTDQRIINLKKEMLDSRDVSQQKPFGPIGTFNGFKHNEPVTKRIDYIFISKNGSIKVMKYATLSDSIDLKYPSDHFPVFVEISFTK